VVQRIDSGCCWAGLILHLMLQVSAPNLARFDNGWW
jgi:hypothetical protein